MPDVQFLLHQIYPILLLSCSSALECQPWPTPTDRVRPTQPRPEEDISGTILFQLKLSVIGSLHLSWGENGIPGDDLTFPSSFSHFFLSEVLCRSQAKEWRGSQIRRIRRKLDIIDKTTDLLFPHHLGRTTEISNVKAQKKKIMRNFIIINKTNFLGNKYALKNVLISIQYISEFKIWSIWSDQFRSTAHND